jgi:hypothetical protein
MKNIDNDLEEAKGTQVDQEGDFSDEDEAVPFMHDVPAMHFSDD